MHLLSSLAYAETCAVIERGRRDRRLADVLEAAAHEAIETGPWRRLTRGPERRLVKDLSRRWPLRGADLWHLATAKTLRAALPELVVLTFDTRLAAAVEGEGLTPPS